MLKEAEGLYNFTYNIKNPLITREIGMNKYKLLSLLMLTGALFALTGCGSSDIDMDNIPNKMDECPNEAEDMDGYQDTDGCPELDNDKDGVEDTEDKCVFVPEDRDGFEDKDGCPDKDNDGDEIPDTKDKCPNEAEDKDNYEDMDGCPELDNDGDGVPDTSDKCVLDAEDKDGFEDADGCPEWDNDKDGIRDNFDKCPNQAEIFNGKDDDDGCPDNEAEQLEAKFDLPVKYRTGTSELTYESVIALEEKIVKRLKAYPQDLLYVYVYMPKIEMDIVTYLELLNTRTQVVVDFLVSKGVASNQLRTRTISEDLFNSKVGTDSDFDQARMMRFERKSPK